MPHDFEPSLAECTAFHAGRQPRVRMPAPAWRKSRLALLISAGACVFTLLGRDFVFMGGIAAGLVASLAAVIGSIVLAGRNTKFRQDANERLPMARCVLGIIAAVLFLAFNCWTCSVFDRRFHDGIYSTMTLAQLRSVARAVDDYRRDYGVSPNHPEDLVAANLILDRELVLPTDNFGWQYICTSQCIPSFDLVPTSRPTDILAYERGPWSVDGIRLFPKELHAVVYANGLAIQLAPAELATALAQSDASQP